jgi:hypothetical protein
VFQNVLLPDRAQERAGWSIRAIACLKKTPATPLIRLTGRRVLSLRESAQAIRGYYAGYPPLRIPSSLIHSFGEPLRERACDRETPVERVEAPMGHVAERLTLTGGAFPAPLDPTFIVAIPPVRVTDRVAEFVGNDVLRGECTVRAHSWGRYVDWREGGRPDTPRLQQDPPVT